MELNIISFSAFLISLISLIGQGLSQQNPFSNAPSTSADKPNLRRCYICNSHKDPYCSDENWDKALVPLVYCHEHIKVRKSFIQGTNITHPFVCRKIIQKVSLSGKTDTRIHRSCGYMPPNKRSYEDEDDLEIPEDRCYKRAGTYEISMYYCTCLADACNHGMRSVASMEWLTVTVAAALGLRFANL